MSSFFSFIDKWVIEIVSDYVKAPQMQVYTLINGKVNLNRTHALLKQPLHPQLGAPWKSASAAAEQKYIICGNTAIMGLVGVCARPLCLWTLTTGPQVTPHTPSTWKMSFPTALCNPLHSSWRIPGTGEPGGLPSLGSHRVGHDWSDLAAAAAASEATWPQWVATYLPSSWLVESKLQSIS